MSSSELPRISRPLRWWWQWIFEARTSESIRTFDWIKDSTPPYFWSSSSLLLHLLPKWWMSSTCSSHSPRCWGLVLLQLWSRTDQLNFESWIQTCRQKRSWSQFEPSDWLGRSPTDWFGLRPSLWLSTLFTYRSTSQSVYLPPPSYTRSFATQSLFSIDWGFTHLYTVGSSRQF